MTLAEAIRDIRRQYRLTQHELAASLGHSQSWCARVERGEVIPTAADAACLSLMFGLKLVRGEWGLTPLTQAKKRETVHA